MTDAITWLLNTALERCGVLSMLALVVSLLVALVVIDKMIDRK